MCSSDLGSQDPRPPTPDPRGDVASQQITADPIIRQRQNAAHVPDRIAGDSEHDKGAGEANVRRGEEIGRASCRERV